MDSLFTNENMWMIKFFMFLAALNFNQNGEIDQLLQKIETNENFSFQVEQLKKEVQQLKEELSEKDFDKIEMNEIVNDLD